MLTMTEAKVLANTNINEAAGQEFEAMRHPLKKGEASPGPTGSIGIVLPTLSVRGKPQAEMSCTVEGCTEKHVREISDWGQSNKCLTHAKTKASGKSAGAGTGGGRRIKLPDGTVFQELKVSATDDAATVEAKNQNNELFETILAQENARKDAEKLQAQADRKAKQEAEKAAREAKVAEEKRAQILANKERVLKYAQEKGLNVSPKVLSAE